MTPDQHYRLTLRALASSYPLAVRLRRLLKMALRCYGFRLVRAEEVPGGSEPAQDATRRECNQNRSNWRIV
jgi:hypothetical protein